MIDDAVEQVLKQAQGTDKNVAVQGLIQGLQGNGCIFHKLSGDKVYFSVPECLTGQPMQGAKMLFQEQGIRLFTKVITLEEV